MGTVGFTSLRTLPVLGLQKLLSPLYFTEMSHCLGTNYYVNFWEGMSSNGFDIKWIFSTENNWKNQNPGGCFGATSQTALPIQPILPNFLVNRPNLQCPQDFIFFNYPGCRIFILFEIHCYFCPHIFWVYHFSLSQCAGPPWSSPGDDDRNFCNERH